MLKLLKIGENGQREINYEAIESMTSAELAQKIKHMSGHILIVLKFEVKEISNYLKFRWISGIVDPLFYMEITFNRETRSYFGELAVSLMKIEEMSEFVLDKKQIAAGEGDYLETVALQKAPMNILPLTDRIDKNENFTR